MYKLAILRFLEKINVNTYFVYSTIKILKVNTRFKTWCYLLVLVNLYAFKTM